VRTFLIFPEALRYFKLRNTSNYCANQSFLFLISQSVSKSAVQKKATSRQLGVYTFAA